MLTWFNVDWDRNRLRIPSPETKHHESGASRTIPLFDELQPHLLDVFHQAEPGAERIVTHSEPTMKNLGPQLSRIVHRAGLEPWPKIWQNLRSTRQTELEEIYPTHVACK